MALRASAAFVAACFVLPGGLAGQAVPIESTHGVRPGDRVSVGFYTASGGRPEEINGDRIVDRNGTIFLPFVGSVAVEGLDADAIRERLRVVYTPFFADPVVTVDTKLRVNITGAVIQPGHYFVDPSSTVLDALAEAGGSQGEIDARGIGLAADPGRVHLIRSGRTHILDLRADHVTREVMDMPIESGDWIYVPPQARSRLREDIQFWGSILSIVSTVATLIVLVGR